MRTVKKISLIFGAILCIPAGLVISTKMWETLVYVLEILFSYYHPVAVIITGMLVLGVIFIAYAIWEEVEE